MGSFCFRTAVLLPVGVGLGAVLFATLAPSASAAPLYTASVSHDGSDVSDCTTGQPGGTSSTPMMARTDCLGHGSGGALAVTAIGHAGAFATGTDFATGGYATSAFAFESGDVILTGDDPSAPPGTTFISLNLDFGGGLSATLEAAAEVRFEVTVFGNLVIAGTFEDAAGVILCNGLPVGIDACGSSFHGPITSEGLLAPLDVPFQLSLMLAVSAGGTDINTSGTADYSGSLDLPVGRDVFNLVGGVTANSADFNIVDNRFIASSAAVPEPSTWLLLMIGLATLGILGQSRVSSRHGADTIGMATTSLPGSNAILPKPCN
jgi:hypothetical protein